MVEIKAKKFNFFSVQGLSENQLKQHEKLYDNYVTRLNEIRTALSREESFEDPNTVFSRIRSLKLGESYALNAVKLHELYFENITGMRRKTINQIVNDLVKTFGSYEKFILRLTEVGLSMRGWAILSYDPMDDRLFIVGQDEHDVGTALLTYPLLVLDVYEHAYMIDYGINRKTYIETFIRNINWEIVNERYMGIPRINH